MAPWIRRRRPGPEASKDLQQPLLENGSSESQDAHQQSSSSSSSSNRALARRSQNQGDWEHLWQILIDSCSKSFGCIWSTIRQCLCRWIPPIVLPEPIHLSPLQEQRLESLRHRAQEQYDGDNPKHQDSLRELWSLSFPGEPCTSLRCDRWKDMGWQQSDPTSDFRGAGCMALHNLIWMARNRPALFQRLLHKSSGTRSEWEYPFAAAGVNLTFMLLDIIGLRDASFDAPLIKSAGRGFCALLAASESAFEEAYCLAFAALDREWLSMRASYMDFPAVLRRVRGQIDAALSNSPASLADLQQTLDLKPADL